MDIWQGIEEFLGVAEAGSFIGAARQSNVSVAHVSRQIKQLELRLGVQLVRRTTRKVSLTSNGQLYAAELADIRARLLNINDQIQGAQAQVRGNITMSCAVGFASRELTRSLARFQKQYPDVMLSVDYSGRAVDLTEDGFDLAIRFGKMQDSSIIARPLTQRPMALLASPDYLEQHGTPKALSDLSEHNCLIASNKMWRFVVDGQSHSVRVSGNWQTNNADALINASLQGLGICYLAEDLVENYLQSGELVTVLPEYCVTDNATWILYQRRDFIPNRVRLLIEHLMRECGDGLSV